MRGANALCRAENKREGLFEEVSRRLHFIGQREGSDAADPQSKGERLSRGGFGELRKMVLLFNT